MAQGEHGSQRAVVAVLLVGGALAAGYFAGEHARPKGPVLAPNERLSDTPTVIVAVRALARLEAVSFHMERVIDLKDRQSRMFGLLQADDEILLVAAGDVIAGVDLTKMHDGDITIDPRARSVQLQVPEPELLSVALDNQRTYVHSRNTDMLAERGDQIETRARQLAQESIQQGALDAGILQRAKESAEHTLTALVRSLGYDRVSVRWVARAVSSSRPSEQ
jgi:hypothetical protein